MRILEIVTVVAFILSALFGLVGVTNLAYMMLAISVGSIFGFLLMDSLTRLAYEEDEEYELYDATCDYQKAC